MSQRHAVLVIDRNPLLRSSVSRMIRRAFPEMAVVEADRLNTALQLVKTHRPALVITDIHLKEGNGLELTEMISAGFPSITVVVFTNEDGPEYRAEALKRGADAFISKADPNGGSILDIIRNCPSMDGSA